MDERTKAPASVNGPSEGQKGFESPSAFFIVSKLPLDGVVPPGGFHYIDKTTGSEQRIEGYSYQDVASNVLRFRLQNSRPPGEPLKDVYDYVCTQWPHFCRDTNPPPRQLDQGPEHISRRVATWMSGFALSSNHDSGVSQEEANRRAAICARCPKNEAYELGVSCQTCVGQVNQLSFIYRHGRTTPNDKELQACDVCNQHNRTAVWSNALPVISEEQKRKLDNACWRK